MAAFLRLSLLLTLILFSVNTSSCLYEDQVGLMDWHQQYIGKVKHAIFHTQIAGRKRVVVSTEENAIASLDLRRGDIFWRRVLGANDTIDETDIALGKYVITLSSGGSILRVWNLPDGQMVWESFLSGSKPSKTFLAMDFKMDKDNIIFVYSGGCLHAISSIDGEVVWKRELTTERYLVLQLRDSENLSAMVISYWDGEISFHQIHIPDLVPDSFGVARILPTKLAGVFALKTDSLIVFFRLIAAFSDPFAFSKGQKAFALVQHEGNRIQLTVKLDNGWTNNLLEESFEMDTQRGFVQKVFINNYIRTDRSHGFRALIVMEDHSLLLLQQGEIVWSREDGLSSVIDLATSELPGEKDGVSVAKVEHNLFEWLKGHILKLKGSSMLASPDDIVAIQGMRLKSSEKSNMTRDHNGFRKLLIVLTRAGKLFALHTGDGRVVWSLLLPSLRKSEACQYSTGLNICQWRVPHHHAMDENPSILIVGRCGLGSDALGLNSLSLAHSIAQVIPLPFTDSGEQRLHLLIDADGLAHLYPRTFEALKIFQIELPNIYWYSVETEKDIIRGYAIHSNCMTDEFCFTTRVSWSIVFPSESEKIISTATRKLNEVFSENWVVYHYLNLRAYKYEISDNKDVWKLFLGKHNLTSPISSYSWPEVVMKSQSYFFPNSVKTMDVTSTAKGITSKRLLIGTIGDQVLALDKRYLDSRQSTNPTQAEKEEGIIPLTDPLPIIPQSYVTHSLQVEGFRGILTVPTKVESTTLVFVYGMELFSTRIAPSRTYDSLMEDFNYALLLITIVALIAAIFVTWVLSEKKELREKWR
ncbi:hypothetical protein NE237_026045 [Protea cynaroides]|uniref:ER membrane protein complex subunit 1 n=1 Tax=Protea cynaroides TaxID=273540 RepID=A0A9Q0H493_9MAGN|nr:hypothetical protein NE237_026045 [Protea cynaroides]